MRAKVGQNSYAFMGQGAVDTVLNLRPDERRGLIEEAAGVRHLRLRMDEARDRPQGNPGEPGQGHAPDR